MSNFNREKLTGEKRYGTGAYGTGRYGEYFLRTTQETVSAFSRVIYKADLYGGGAYGTEVYSQKLWTRNLLT